MKRLKTVSEEKIGLNYLKKCNKCDFRLVYSDISKKSSLIEFNRHMQQNHPENKHLDQ